MTGCGFTPDQCDAMAMHDVLALLQYWRETPPAHEILAAVHRIAAVPQPDPNDPSNIGGLIGRFPDGTITNR